MTNGNRVSPPRALDIESGKVIKLMMMALWSFGWADSTRMEN